MSSCVHLVTLAILALLPLFGAGETCLNPQVTSKVYTTTETSVSVDTVVVVEFSLDCKNNMKDLNLYAEFNGKTIPASRVGEAKYQVSFSGTHKKIPSGFYNLRLFDEEGYTDLRKAQRSGDKPENIKSLVNIGVNHPGASQGFYLQSEFVAAMVSILVWWMAYTARSNLQA